MSINIDSTSDNDDTHHTTRGNHDTSDTTTTITSDTTNHTLNNHHTRTLLIASGKGGVGKSSVTANLAIALASQGKKVAIIDADVWGFSIPRMLGIAEPPQVLDDWLIPPETHGVRAISMGFFAQEDEPVIWRGPMLHKALQQFLTDVAWDNPDYMLVDLPPGTGDISLSLAKFLPRAEAYVVTTPNLASQTVAQRAGFMFKKVRISVRGVIENMSWFTGDDGKRYHIFGAGGGASLAERLDVDLIGQIPLAIPLREGSDHGQPIMAAKTTAEGDPVTHKGATVITKKTVATADTVTHEEAAHNASVHTEVHAAFMSIAQWILTHKPTKRTHPELTVI